jgi:hypothetical protein
MKELSETSRIWIYQAKEEIVAAVLPELQIELDNFARQWVSHSNALRAKAEIRHNRFLILMVDESQAGASGCSIDKSVHFIQALERKFGLNLFDRMTFTFEKDGQIHAANRDDFAELYKNGSISNETIVYDNLIKTKGQIQTDWRKKLGESWHARMV